MAQSKRDARVSWPPTSEATAAAWTVHVTATPRGLADKPGADVSRGRQDRVAESGRAMRFPLFDVESSGQLLAAAQAPHARFGPGHVGRSASESTQR